MLGRLPSLRVGSAACGTRTRRVDKLRAVTKEGLDYAIAAGVAPRPTQPSSLGVYRQASSLTPFALRPRCTCCQGGCAVHHKPGGDCGPLSPVYDRLMVIVGESQDLGTTSTICASTMKYSLEI
jgi:hypothetical protein